MFCLKIETIDSRCPQRLPLQEAPVRKRNIGAHRETQSIVDHHFLIQVVVAQRCPALLGLLS